MKKEKESQFSRWLTIFQLVKTSPISMSISASLIPWRREGYIKVLSLRCISPFLNAKHALLCFINTLWRSNSNGATFYLLNFHFMSNMKALIVSCVLLVTSLHSYNIVQTHFSQTRKSRRKPLQSQTTHPAYFQISLFLFRNIFSLFTKGKTFM